MTKKEIYKKLRQTLDEKDIREVKCRIIMILWDLEKELKITGCNFDYRE